MSWKALFVLGVLVLVLAWGVSKCEIATFRAVERLIDFCNFSTYHHDNITPYSFIMSIFIRVRSTKTTNIVVVEQMTSVCFTHFDHMRVSHFSRVVPRLTQSLLTPDNPSYFATPQKATLTHAMVYMHHALNMEAASQAPTTLSRSQRREFTS